MARKKKEKNKIVNELTNKGFYITTPLGENDNFAYAVYRKPESGGLEFRFTIDSAPDDNTVVFNGEVYDSVESLEKGVETHNAVLEWPVYTYDPIFNEQWRTEMRILHYLKNVLGYVEVHDNKNFNTQTFALNAKNGHTLISVSFSLGDKKALSFNCGDGTVIHYKVDNLGDTIGTITAMTIYACTSVFDALDRVMNAKGTKVGWGGDMREFDGSMASLLKGGSDPRQRMLEQLRKTEEAIVKSLEKDGLL